MKKWIIISIILIIFTCGLSALSVVEFKQLKSQEIKIANLQKTIGENNQKIISLSKENASESAKIKSLLIQPTPTPIVEYKSQEASNQDTSSAMHCVTYGGKPTGECETDINGERCTYWNGKQFACVPDVWANQAQTSTTHSHCISDGGGGVRNTINSPPPTHKCARGLSLNG